jgi:hypothetical protein
VSFRIVATLCGLLLPFASLRTQQGDVDPAFRPILDQLRQKVQIPVLLPSKLVDLGQGSDRVYAVVTRAEPRSYSIVLAFTADCNGASFCRIGSLTGSAAGKKRLSGKRIRLARGVAGYYIEGACGANCEDSVISWKAGPNLYTAGIKGGTAADVSAMANAVLSAAR